MHTEVNRIAERKRPVEKSNHMCKNNIKIILA
jgi:hypothetical protein